MAKISGFAIFFISSFDMANSFAPSIFSVWPLNSKLKFSFSQVISSALASARMKLSHLTHSAFGNKFLYFSNS